MCTVTITSSKGTKAQFSHNAGGDVPTFFYLVHTVISYGDGSKPPGEPQIAGKWMFIPLKMVLIGIDPYPHLVYKDDQRAASAGDPPQPHKPGFGILRSVCS